MRNHLRTFTLLAAMLALYWWSEYIAGNSSELPSGRTIAAIFVAWVVLYLGVRALKKSGYIKG